QQPTLLDDEVLAVSPVRAVDGDLPASGGRFAGCLVYGKPTADAAVETIAFEDCLVAEIHRDVGADRHGGLLLFVLFVVVDDDHIGRGLGGTRAGQVFQFDVGTVEADRAGQLQALGVLFDGKIGRHHLLGSRDVCRLHVVALEGDVHAALVAAGEAATQLQYSGAGAHMAVQLQTAIAGGGHFHLAIVQLEADSRYFGG